MQSAVSRSEKPPSLIFTVMTLNLRFGRADDGPNSWKFRKKCLPPLISRFNPDLIGFQEVNDFQLHFLIRILPGYQFIGQRQPAPAFWQNNILFHKKNWSRTLKKHFFLSPTPLVPSRFRKSRWPRQCTMGVFNRNDRQLACTNTHLDFDTGVQLQSVRLIITQLASLPPEVPVILMGDFNADRHSPCYRLLTGSGKNEGHFKDAFGMACPGTHHGFTGRSSGGAIDWILFRGNLQVRQAEVVRERFKGLYPSDHFPLVAVFGWED